MKRSAAITTGFLRATLALGAVLCASVFAQQASAQIAAQTDDSGRRFFVNAEPPQPPSLTASKSHNLYMSSSWSLPGRHSDPEISRDGVEKIVRDAADKQNVDPALVRAVIETESNWNPKAYSRKGAGGLMQLIPTTAQRYGANDLFDPQQNVNAGVKHLKWLLERYNGNLDLALAAYNAGEGAVDRVHGVPAYRETRSYVQKVQNAYFRPGSGRLADAYVNYHAIHKDVTPEGRIIFTNE
jgi:soluble lytic murein transglycosylase-like protein